MLLVDRILELVPGEHIVAVKAVSLNEPWYAHISDAPEGRDLGYPPALLLESWGQAAGLLAGAGPTGGMAGEDSVMLFGGASAVEYARPVWPGELVTHHVRLGRVFDEALMVEGEARCGDEVVMTVGQGLMAFRPAAVLRPTSD
ncbi:beta-hydroxyacyl-ACP dehydratase [Streptomyces profundus]|nr:beta-hydroxyacyl-ACP dehydratase [Streptomyces sp. MA3_2.13]